MFTPVLLAVDDRQDNLFVLKQLINDSFDNSILFTAESAEKGLEIANESRLDIVLTDVQMPGMNGIDFCKTLKSNPKTSDVIVLLLTAHKSNPELIVEGLEAGAFDFISKPIDNQELVARIKAALRIKKAETELKIAQNKLEEKVRERTKELELSNFKLKREIEEREKIEKALIKANHKIATVMEGTDEGFWDWDLVNKTVTFDANWNRLLGYEPVEKCYDEKWWLESVDSEFQNNFKTAIKEYLSGKEKYYETEYRFRDRFGKWIWVLARGICIEYDENHKPLRLIGTQRDITEKRKAEEAYQRLIAAIEQVEDIILITDINANILYVNPSFEKTTGYLAEEVKGLNPRLLKSGIQDAKFYRDLWEKLTSGEVWCGRFSNKRKDGSFYDEEASITPVKNKQGELAYYIAVKRDVTRQVKLEQQLRQAQKMEAIGTLAGGIAHDFNNILFAIQGYNSLSLRLTETTHPTYNHLQKLGQATERAKELVSQILTFSRQTEQKLRPMLIQPVVKEAMNLLRATIPTTIEVRQDINPEGGLILGDVTQVHQIIINLATNAYQAMRENGGVLTVTLSSVEINSDTESRYRVMEPGTYCELVVSDTGSGMNRKVMDRIFEPYFSTKEQGEGTGMGLSIVHGIISAYKGRIFVESEEGKGTTFRILIPEIETISYDSELEADIPESELVGTGSIAVVDDEEQISEMLKNMLEELGYTVSAFTSSMQVLEKFTENPDQYDLLITDMTMPKMTGADLASKILELKPNFPIILCTGYSDKMDQDEADRIGIREFMLKPISIDLLAKTIRGILQASMPI